MSRRIAVPVFPGTNSEDETVRLLRACGGDAELVHWTHADRLGEYDAYVLSGGFAYEDRIRAGAIAAHDRIMDYVTAAAERGKLVFGICNGAQILLEAGLVPGTAGVRRPTAAFAKNAPEPHFVCRHVYLKLIVEPARSPITAALERECAGSGVGRARGRAPRGDAAAAGRDRDGASPGLRLRARRRHRRRRRRAERLRTRVRRPGEPERVTCWRSCRTPNATAGTSIISTAQRATTCSPRRGARPSFAASSRR